MVIKVDSEAVKVLGGGTQAYNKATTDKRRPLIMTSPGQRQKALKRANDPDIQELEGVIVNLSEELGVAYASIKGLNKTLEEAELAVEAGRKIIASQEAVLAAAKPAPKKKAVPKKAPTKDSGD